jgi:hypothetical protein
MAAAPQTFGAQIRELLLRYQTQREAIIRQTVQEVAERVVNRTPVDTGHLRAQWHTAIDGTPASHPSAPGAGAGGEPAIDAAHTLAAPGHVWGLYNGARYAQAIEYGGSPHKAPAGMVRVTLAELPTIVAEMAQAVGAR